jgi:hypothetical protein
LNIYRSTERQATTALSLIHTLYNSLPHALYLLSLPYLHQLSPGNGFQFHSFPSFRVHVLTGPWLSQNLIPGWPSSHTNLLLFSLPSQDSLVIAAVPCYIVSAWTAQKTPLPTVLLLLHASLAAITYQRPLLIEPLPSNGSCIAAHFTIVA